MSTGSRPNRVPHVVVVGSGFGGSVAALRLVEKGYRVTVLEAGRRFADEDLPKTSWDLRRFLWAPALGCFGIQRLTLLRDVLVLSGAGVGGGSLVYANTLYEPLEDFYADPQWSGITDWRSELAPHYEQAERMLGVRTYDRTTPADEAMRDVARAMGVEHTFRPTPVAVTIGPRPGEDVGDPYFGGAGPARRTCTHCGACMTGCRHNAKNTLVKNYLYLAESAGAVVEPLSTVDVLRQVPDGRWALEVYRTGKGRRSRRTVLADEVVLAAGTLGTQRLLHRMRAAGHLPALSPRLGELTRTNSESILGATAHGRDIDYTDGVAITSSFYPDEHTHVEPVRYGHGSNAMGMLATLLTDGGGRVPRWVKFLGQALRHPTSFGRSISVRHWSERSVIALVMQSHDNSLRLHPRRGLLRGTLTSRQGHGEPNPSWIPAGNTAARLLAERIDGDPLGSWTELADIPVTAHIIGGCPIAETADAGVIDPYQRVHGYPGLHVSDGAAVTANLGVNPSLTITAQAERAMALWPNVGEADPRPAPGQPYRRLAPVPPYRPVVPASAPAALRQPLAEPA